VTLEDYLQQLIEKELTTEASETGREEQKSGMVWEDGLLIYGAGTPLPAGSLDSAIRRSREERSQLHPSFAYIAVDKPVPLP
jgi:hypothetical protein